MFHTIIELSSIVVAFTVFIITWNSKKVLDNHYLYFVGVAYLFIGSLDLLHTLSFKGMNIMQGNHYYANQFWIATRSMEAITLALGFYFLKRKTKINADVLFLVYLAATVLITLSILYWHIFPVCYIEGVGQTTFKLIAEYVIILVLCFSLYTVKANKSYFNPLVYRLLLFSIIFTILSEFSFTLYVFNTDILNAIGHIFKLISFYLIYKANVEMGFKQPTMLLFNGIKESEVRYRTLANNLPVLIFRFDQEFNCNYTNAEEKAINVQLFQNLLAEIKLALVKVKESGQPSFKSNFKLVINNEPQTYALDLILESQQTEKQEQTYLVLCLDITKLKLAEEQLLELNATKDKFLSIIAHDLKNPFTTILASSDLIQKSAGKLAVDKIQSLALRIHDAAKIAYLLLENLLSWSMVQTGALKPKPVVIDVAVLIETVAKNMTPHAFIKGIEISTPKQIVSNCYADLDMTQTILRNLLSNAIKFSFSDSTITIIIKEEDTFVKFSVNDKGIGIDEENLAQLLSNNKNTSTAGTAKEKGTGLGLQLCKEFIYLNGGTLNIQSSVNNGSTFEFSLPKNKS
ncbi:MASE3 domain-containing protein [Pedobacter alpinus]|uniref:histidine kinase n=1 Tax=Pedobacter alpinus TaxID=1590643 RepID=A0ABW5TSY8_9SPHI